MIPVFTKGGQHHGDGGLVVEGVEDRLHPGLQLADGSVVVPQLSRSALLAPVGGGTLQVAEDDVEDVDDVITGAGAEHVDKGDQGGHPALWGQVGQLGGPGVLRIAGQAGHPSRGQARQVEFADAEGADLAEAFQRLDQPPDGGAERRSAQTVQLRAPLALRHHQEALQRLDQLGRSSVGEPRPQPPGGPLAHASHEPGQHVLAGQHDPLRQHPLVGRPEQHRGAEVVCPGLSVEPAQQRDVGRLAGEVRVAVATPDLRRALPAHGELAVASEDARVGDVELAGQGGDDGCGNGTRVGQERPDGPHGDQLGGEAEAGDIAGPAPCQADVGLAQVAPTAQPVPLDELGKPAVAGLLGRLSCGDRHEVAAFAVTSEGPAWRWPSRRWVPHPGRRRRDGDRSRPG